MSALPARDRGRRPDLEVVETRRRRLLDSADIVATATGVVLVIGALSALFGAIIGVLLVGLVLLVLGIGVL